jgi:hypothetical protein
VLAFEGVLGLVAEPVAPARPLRVELGPAQVTRVHRLVGVSLLVVDLPRNDDIH